MKKTQIAAQLYCFRDFIKTPEGIADTFRRLRTIGYEAVQLTTALPESLKPADILSLLKDAGLTAVSSHEGGAKILDHTAQVIAKLQALGIRHTAYAGPHVSPTGTGEVIALARRLNETAKTFRAQGITLAYHNHAIEFKRFEGKFMLELIYDHAPDLAGEIDTHWIQRGGGDPVKWIRRLANRMEYLHIKDYGVDSSNHADIWSNVPVMKPVGSGSLDWDAILSAAEESGVKYFIVEHDGDVIDPFDSFEESFRFLEKNYVK
ncbi:MAG: Xylose isomerase-like TIM barrel [Lentisphaerae bacterium ADurb.Bin242]|nr:MAG: Xylose isomerase-like TIM barrel [Lentisphaerae bacterium ADurb.Bin242]